MRTLDLNECADFLKIDRSTALKLAGDGLLPGAMFGRAWVFLEDDIVEYVRATAAEQMRARRAAVEVDVLLGVTSTRRNRHRNPRPELPPVSSPAS